MTIIHSPTREFVVPVARNKLQIQFHCPKHLKKKWSVVYWNRFYEEKVQSIQCEPLGRDGEFDYYICEIATAESVKYLRYYFAALDGSLYISPKEAGTNVPEDFFEYLYTNDYDVLEVPGWAKGAVAYQIFPERFCNGEPANDPAGAAQWDGVPTRTNFFGGDLRGIIDKLDYLEKLHIDLLYLTPIFKSPSNHKYDTEDYLAVDPSLGTIEDLKELTTKCHERGIRVILDGVFNHCGYTFAPFQDVLQNGQNSAYKDWFIIESFPVETDPVNYECVGYYKWMPKLRMKNRKVRDYFLRVGTYWIREADIDGWRLDVADEVDFTFWQEFRRAVKTVKSDALLIGETWKDGRDMLRGDQMDSVMNYLFRNAVKDFFAAQTLSTEEFDNMIERLLCMYPQPVNHVLYNLIGSHDTERFLSLCGGDKRKLRLAAAFQMTFPGMPAVYYGDEAGMTGKNDPDCRKAMDWENIDGELLAFYQKMTALRHKLTPLKQGSFLCIHCGENTFGFARRIGGRTVYVLMNRSGVMEEICVPAFEPYPGCLKSLMDGRIFDLESIGKNDCFYHSDMMHYQSKFNLVLPAYHVEIIKTKEETE
jgi:cyclomaltodextrinase